MSSFIIDSLKMQSLLPHLFRFAQIEKVNDLGPEVHEISSRNAGIGIKSRAPKISGASP